VIYEEAALDSRITNEIFQRRHIIIHNGGLVSPQYLAKVTWLSSSPVVGTELKVDLQYLSNALNQLTVLGVSLVYLVMRKLAPSEEAHTRLDVDINDLVYELLANQRWACVGKIASTAIPQIKVDAARLTLQVNRWIAMKKSHGLEAIRDEVSAWDTSALVDTFKVAKLILLDDESAVDVARKMLEQGKLDQDDVDRWPLFADIRGKLVLQPKEQDLQSPSEAESSDGPVLN
jgi:hypothetical protein